MSSIPINHGAGRSGSLQYQRSSEYCEDDIELPSNAFPNPSPPVTSLPAASPPLYGGSLMHLNRGAIQSAASATEDDVLDSLSHADGNLDELRVSLVHGDSLRRSVAGATAVTPASVGYHTPGAHSASHQSAMSFDSAVSEQKNFWDQLLDIQSLIFGFLNAAINIPVMIAFCKVIFHDSELQPFQDKLVRLVFLVQDVGLIFLSSMASSVVERGVEQGRDISDILATVLLMLSLATCMVGILVVVVARLKVASIVQYVPIPVVGGYLAFVGYFLCVSGVQLATGVELKEAKSYFGLVTFDAFLRCLPMICTWQVFHHTVRWFTSPAALPTALISIVAAFYVVLLACGWTLEDAQNNGWVPQPSGSMSKFWEIWYLFEAQDWPGNIDWGAFPEQLPNLFALFIVVSFGSCMDIAAIQAEHPDELDFNNELELIGISNACCGLSGLGYTGSYIFSQTLFNIRNGAKGPLIGGAIILFEVSMCVLPTSPVSYIPNFFFGGLMLWLGVDIMYDWLVACWGKVRRVEYAVIWITFCAVTRLGLEFGIVIGILCSMAAFAFEYSKLSVTCFNVAASRSSFMRTYHQRYVLDQLSSNMVAIALSGYVFFGSATSVSEKAILISDLLLRENDDNPAAEQQQSRHHAEGMQARIAIVKAAAPKTLLLDFRKVTGFDATAAQTFKVLRQRLEAKGVQMLITHIPSNRPYIHELLVANGVVGRQIVGYALAPQRSDCDARCMVFDTLNSGLHYCEEQLLEVAVQYHVCQAMVDDMPLSQLLEANRSVHSIRMPLLPDGVMGDLETVAMEMMPYTEQLEFLNAGASVFCRGDLPRAIFIVQSGIISCEADMTVTRTVGHESSLLLKAMINQPGQKDGNEGLSMQPSGEAHGNETSVNLVEYGPGGILGDLDYFLQRTRSFSAKVKVAPCRMLRISHDNMQKMAALAPRSLLVLQTIILRGSSLSSAHALEALEMANL